jgi:hypothetical protein
VRVREILGPSGWVPQSRVEAFFIRGPLLLSVLVAIFGVGAAATAKLSLWATVVLAVTGGYAGPDQRSVAGIASIALGRTI